MNEQVTLAVMDGAPVHKGDVVFDLAYGTGKVVRGDEGGIFSVEFVSMPHRAVSYNGAGYTARFMNRTLFWSAPYIVTPPQQTAEYSKYRRIAQAAAETLLPTTAYEGQ